MSKLQELLREFCPDGVEYKELGEIVTIKNGRDYKHLGKGNIPVYGSGGIMTYVDTYAYNKPTVLIPRKGSLGNLFYVDTPFWNVDTIFYTEVDTQQIDVKYLYYLLAKEHLENLNKAGGVPSLTQSILNKIMLPIPPLEVQEEIVRILDHFTNLAAELQAELQARKEQYEYYRNKLLTFNKTGGVQSVTWMKMSEICKIYTGGEPPKDAIKGNYKDSMHPYPIWGNGKEVYGYASSYKIDKDATVISSIGANAGTVYFRKAYFTPIIRLKVLIPKNDNILSKFLYFYLSTVSLAVKSSSVPNMNANDVKKLLIPVPSLAEQERIVSILDKFEALVNDLSEGLPAEIAAVQEQYEYYRNKLLSFPRVKVSA